MKKCPYCAEEIQDDAIKCQSCRGWLKNNQKTVTDINGNIYNTAKYGKQIWMTENLKVTNYNNGEPLHHFKKSQDWYPDSIGSYSNYNNSENYGEICGRLYNWVTICQPFSRSREFGICPEGWHIPTREDWTELLDYFYGIGKTIGLNDLPPGIINNRDDLWEQKDQSLFTVFPSGFRNCQGEFLGINDVAFLWTSTDSDNTNFDKGLDSRQYRPWPRPKVHVIKIDFNAMGVYEETHLRDYEFSVRCIKD